MDENIMQLNDVYVAFNSSKLTLHKTVVGLILTSRMTLTVISKLVLNDLMMQTYY